MVLPLIVKIGKDFSEEKMLKFSQFCNSEGAPGKISVFKNCSLSF